MVILETGEGLPSDYVPGVCVRYLFRKGEAGTVCRAALQAAPNSLNTHELATLCLASKGFDVNDMALRKGMQATLTGILGKRVLRREITRGEKREWRLDLRLKS